jgi:hypothetical protein
VQWEACKRRSDQEILWCQTRSLIVQRVSEASVLVDHIAYIGFRAGIRPFTFFEKGVVGHVGFADPFDAKISKV